MGLAMSGKLPLLSAGMIERGLNLLLLRLIPLSACVDDQRPVRGACPCLDLVSAQVDKCTVPKASVPFSMHTIADHWWGVSQPQGKRSRRAEGSSQRS